MFVLSCKLLRANFGPPYIRDISMEIRKGFLSFQQLLRTVQGTYYVNSFQPDRLLQLPERQQSCKPHLECLRPPRSHQLLDKLRPLKLHRLKQQHRTSSIRVRVSTLHYGNQGFVQSIRQIISLHHLYSKSQPQSSTSLLMLTLRIHFGPNISVE